MLDFDLKPWWTSRTIWGGLMALAGSGLGVFGYELGGADQSALIEAGASAVTAVGGIVSIWGRVKASKTLTK